MPTIQDVLTKSGYDSIPPGRRVSRGRGLNPRNAWKSAHRALAQEGHGEQCLKALELEPWALCRAGRGAACRALKARWDCVDEKRGSRGIETTERDGSTRNGVGRAGTSLRGVLRGTETMTAVGLRAKGKCSATSWPFQRDGRHVCTAGSNCETSTTWSIVASTGKSCECLAVLSADRKEFRSRRTLLSVVLPTIWRFKLMPRHFLCAMSVSLVALSTLAFAGPGDVSNSGSVDPWCSPRRLMLRRSGAEAHRRDRRAASRARRSAWSEIVVMLQRRPVHHREVAPDGQAVVGGLELYSSGSTSRWCSPQVQVKELARPMGASAASIRATAREFQGVDAALYGR